MVVSPSFEIMLTIAIVQAFAFLIWKGTRDYETRAAAGLIEPALYASVANSAWYQFSFLLAVGAMVGSTVYAFIALPWYLALFAMWGMAPLLAVLVGLLQGAVYASALAHGRGIGAVTFLPWGLVLSTCALAWVAAHRVDRGVAPAARASIVPASPWPEAPPNPVFMAPSAVVPAPSAPPAETTGWMRFDPPFRLRVRAGAANLRVCPGTHCASLTTLRQGVYDAWVVGREGPWAHVKLQDESTGMATGWVHESAGRIVSGR